MLSSSQSPSVGTGLTLAQFAIRNFWTGLDNYRQALATGTAQDIVATSLQIHAATGGVPKRFHRLVWQTLRETKRVTPFVPTLAAG